MEFNTQILTCWADNMYQTTQSLQKQVDFHSSQQHSNEIIIGGIIEQRNQSCWEATKQFLAAKLNIQVADGEATLNCPANATGIYAEFVNGLPRKITHINCLRNGKPWLYFTDFGSTCKQ